MAHYYAEIMQSDRLKLSHNHSFCIIQGSVGNFSMIKFVYDISFRLDSKCIGGLLKNAVMSNFFSICT